MLNDTNIFPKYIEFQTHSYCNSKCLYCPYENLSKTVSNGLIDDNLFEKIVRECSKYKLERMIPYLNNEPLMDKKYTDRIELIRKYMPDVFIEIATNAELLTQEIGERLFQLNVDEIRLSVHGLYRETYNKLMKGLNYDTVYSNIETLINTRDKKGYGTKLAIVVLRAKIISEEEKTKIKEFWSKQNVSVYEFEVHDRAGSIENTYDQFSDQILKSELKGCSFRRELERMHILYNGDVVSCCQDWKEKYYSETLKSSPFMKYGMEKNINYSESIYLGQGLHLKSLYAKGVR